MEILFVCHFSHITLLFILLIITFCIGQIQIPIGMLLESNHEPDSKTALMFSVSQTNSRKLNEPKIIILYDDFSKDNTFDFIKKVCSLMSTGIFVLYGSASVRTIQACQSYSLTYQMPLVVNHFTRLHSNDDKEMIIYLTPSYIQALAELIEVLNWKNLTYIYDHFDGIHRLEAVKSRIKTKLDQVTMVQLQQATSAHDDLRRIDQSNVGFEEKFMVIDVSSRMTMMSLIKQIAQVGMNREGYHYILAHLDVKIFDLSQLQLGGANVYGFQLVDFDKKVVQNLQAKWKALEPLVWPGAGTDFISAEAALSMDSIELIIKAVTQMMSSRKDIFQFTFRRGNVYNINATVGIKCYLRPVQPWMHGNSLFQAMKQISFQGYSGQVQFDQHGRRDNYSLQVVAVTSRSPLTKIGEWHSKTGLEIINDLVIRKHQEQELTDNRTVVISMLIPPFLMIRTKPDSSGLPVVDNSRFEGYAKDLTDAISDYLQFQYILKVIPDTDCGKNLGNGTWTGLLGRLIDKSAHIAIGPLSTTLERERFVDFSTSFMKSGISALVHQPAKVKPNMFSFMEPFSPSLWLSIVLVYIVVSLVLFLVSCLQFDPLDKGFNNRITLKNSFWFILSSLLSQGSDITLRSPASRIVGGIWWFFVLIMLTSYTANLAAFLTIERINRPIKSVDELVNQNEVSYGVAENGFLREFFESTSILSYKHMWTTMKDSYNKVMVKTMEDGLQRVQSSRGKYALLLESSLAEYYTNKKPCNIIEITSSFSHKGFGVATQRRSTLSKEINHAILHLKEEGTLHRLKKHWWVEKNECFIKQTKDSKTHSLQLTSVVGIFLILILGLFIALFVTVAQTIGQRKKMPVNRGVAAMSKLHTPLVKERRFQAIEV